MSHLLTILGLAASSNLDTAGVGLAYGARKFRLPLLPNFVCALIPCLGTYLMMVLGIAVRSVISGQIASVLGAAIIMTAGVVLIIKYCTRYRATAQAETLGWRHLERVPMLTPSSCWQKLKKMLGNPLQIDGDYSGSIGFTEATILALALTLNNLACGFAAGLMALNVFLLVSTSFCISLIFFTASVKIGQLYLSRRFGERGDLVAGIMLILLGIYELVA